MDVRDFYKYIDSPEHLNASSVAELQDVLNTYPYFQTVHTLYLKALYNQNNFKFNDQLKFSSVHLNNRKKLLYFLKEKAFTEGEEVFKKIKNKPVVLKDIQKNKEKTLTSVEVKTELQKKAISIKEELLFKEIIELPLKKLDESKVLDKKDSKKNQNQELFSEKLFFDKKKPVLEQKNSKKDIDLSKSINKQTIDKEEVKPKIRTAQEIIQQRMAELIQNSIKKEKEPKLQKKEEPRKLISENELKKNSLVEEKNLETKKQVKKEPKKKSNIQKIIDKKIINNDEISLVDLSDLIQIPAPSEYFIEEIRKPSVKKTKQSQSKIEDKHSFSYWLDYLQEKKQKLEKQELISKQKPQNTLVDSFLSDKTFKTIRPLITNTEPQIVPEENNLDEKISISFMTETLAQIYIKQAHYNKAIEAYQKLSLKYPKKNTYFASQIEKIKKIQLNS